jgi:AhpD family alkylhydroperoxidase
MPAMAQADEAQRAIFLLLIHPAGDLPRWRMTMRKLTRGLLGFAAVLAIGTAGGFMQSTSAEDASAQATYRDIEQTLGSVPSFFKQFPETGIAGAWTEFKSVQLNPNSKLNGKTKELLGLAVASQIPCQYCVYFHTAAAKANGATDEEVREAVAMAAIVRHWSTVLNGMQVDLAAFKRETDAVLRAAADKPKTADTSR